MHLLRTRFGKDIVADFLPPARKTRRNQVIIFCDGMPSVPAKKTLLEFWSRKGFWVIHPRYRGTWESGGKFLAEPLQNDIFSIIDQLPKGLRSLWDYKVFKIKNPEILLVGNSFGGPAAIFCSLDKRVSKAILVSPVTDWVSVHKINSRDAKLSFIKEAYGEAYRVNPKNWNKLRSGKFYNPMSAINKIDGKKLVIFHAKDDNAVPWKSVKKFSNTVGAKMYTAKTGGHYSSRDTMRPGFYNKIKGFLA